MLAELYGRVRETEGFLGLESASDSPFKLAVAYFDSPLKKILLPTIVCITIIVIYGHVRDFRK